MNEILYIKHADIELGENCRKFFNPDTLHELQASIREHGVRQNLQVQDLGNGRFRLITGERRWRATGSLLEELDVMVMNNPSLQALRSEREMLPAMVVPREEVAKAIELNLIENLQRDDITPAEEAEGYATMLERVNPDTGAKYTTEEIALKTGHMNRNGTPNASYVRRRLKLRNAPDFLLAAVNDRTIAATTAEMVGKIPDEKAREQCARRILGPEDQDFPLNYEQARNLIQRDFMKSLKGTYFDPEDESLVPEKTDDQGVRIEGGSCDTCPMRSGRNAELQEEFAQQREGGRGSKPGIDPNLCTNPSCFRLKLKAKWTVEKKKAKANGQRVIDGEEAKKVFSGGAGALAYDSEFAHPDEKPEYRDLKRDVPDDVETFGNLAQAASIDPALAWNEWKSTGELLIERQRVLERCGLLAEADPAPGSGGGGNDDDSGASGSTAGDNAGASTEPKPDKETPEAEFKRKLYALRKLHTAIRAKANSEWGQLAILQVLLDELIDAGLGDGAKGLIMALDDNPDETTLRMALRLENTAGSALSAFATGLLAHYIATQDVHHTRILPWKELLEVDLVEPKPKPKPKGKKKESRKPAARPRGGKPKSAKKKGRKSKGKGGK